MKTRFLMLLVLTLMLTPLQSFAEEIEIKFGETVSYEDLNLSFYDVGDSRCPLDVTCVWEGKVFTRIQTSNQTHKMGGTLEIGFPFTYITPYTITLIDVKPHPISTEKSDYIAILEITKLSESEEPIKVNYNDFRNASGEIICQGYSSGGGFLEYPECGPMDQFVINVLIIVLPIAGVTVVSILMIRRKRK